jgi:hypothetical protein
MTMVGHVLFHAPRDPDGLWIHRGVARVLDAKDAQDIRDGYSTELFNSRGAYWVDPSGAPEKALSETYRDRAETVENAGYPHFAATLRQVSRSYQREAEHVRTEHLDE